MNIIHFDSIDSTSKYINNNYENLDNLTFVQADVQTNGKGRGDHFWESENGKNLLFSFLLKNNNLIYMSSYLSTYIPVIICNFLEERYKVDNLAIKWPNDIYYKDSKLVGILLQSSLPYYISVGIGININQDKWDKMYSVSPISLKLILNKEIKKLINLIINLILYNRCNNCYFLYVFHFLHSTLIFPSFP